MSLHHGAKSLWHVPVSITLWSLSTSNAIKRLCHLFQNSLPEVYGTACKCIWIFRNTRGLLSADSHQWWKQQQQDCRCMQLEACRYKHCAPHTHDYIWSPKVSTMWLLNLVSLHILQTDSWHQLLRWYWEQIALTLRQHGATSEFKQLSSITNTLSSPMHNGWVVKNRECLSGSLLHL